MGIFINSKIKVSVVMLTYNHDKYIAKAIESILFQKTDFKYEILIKDDCSTDRTREIIQLYASKYSDRIKVFLNDQHVGVIANLIEIYRKTRGKYIAHIEGDDFWISSDKLQKQYDFLENNPSFSAVFCQSLLVDADGNRLNGHISWIKYKSVFSEKDFDGTTLPGQTSALFQRNIFITHPELLNCFRASPYIGDRISVLLLLKFGNIACFKRKMAAYRYIRGSDEANITSLVYSNRINGLLTDIRLCIMMERIARKYNIKFNLKKCKQLIFARAVYYYITSEADDRSNIICAMRDFKNKYIYFLEIGICFLRLFFERYDRLIFNNHFK